MIQLIVPDLSIIGNPDYCLSYVQSAYNVPATDPHQADAWQAWEATQFKHTDLPPTDISVPVWFSWTGTINGVAQNWGHVAVSTPQGIYTNPLSGSGHEVFPSVQALATAYGVQYVGWSEDIETLRVVQGGSEMLTKDQIIVIYTLAFDDDDVDVPQDIINAYTGKSVDGLLTQLARDPTYLAHKQAVNNPPTPTMNKTNVTAYINKNLQ